ncbi:MAG: hypothetical protein ACI4QA_05740 [Candidatus Spyradosoma sp.]
MIVHCPKCKAEYDAGPDYFGKIFRCRCGEEVSVPVPPAPAKTPAAPAPAKAPIPAKAPTFTKAPTAAKPAFTPRPATPKPAVATGAVKRPAVSKPSVAAPAKPEAAKPHAEKTPGAPAKEEKAAKPAAAQNGATVYAVWAKVACVVGIVFEVFNTLVWIGVFWLMPAPDLAPLSLGASGASCVFFLLAWSVTTALILLAFAALAAIFRTADAACRSSGARPLLM